MTVLNRRQLFQAGAATAAAAAAAPPTAAVPGKAEASKFRCGLVTFNVASLWDLDTLLKVCKNAGISPVEFRTTHKHGVEPTLTKEQRKDVKKKCADAGVEIWGSGTVCEFHDPQMSIVQKNIETCKQFVELVADIGGRGVKVRPNDLPKAVPVDKTLEQIGKALIPCGQAAANAGLEIWVEVHGKGTSIPANIKKVMEHCGHKSVGLTWNSNPTDIVDGSVAASFKMLWPWVRSCHINDLYKDSTGVYPYRELFRLFRENGYDRVTMCEVGKPQPDPMLGTEMLRYYKALWTELCRG